MVSTDWTAPHARTSVSGDVRVPGSKSITNRALVLAALSTGPSTITGGLVARDSELMIAGLRALGIGVEAVDGAWHVRPGPIHGPAVVDCGLAGTVMRFLPPLAGLATGPVDFVGDPHASQRPMHTMLGALRSLGVAIAEDAQALPFRVVGHGTIPGGSVQFDASASSQFVSGLLLAGASFERGLDLQHHGGALPSLPHIEMTIAMLAEHGVEVRTSGENPNDLGWRIAPGPIEARDRSVEPDLSNALPFLAAAMATGGTVSIPDWPRRTTQPGGQLPALLSQMGGQCTQKADRLTVRGPQHLSGLVADLRDVGELTPVLAALAALASTPSRLTGIAHLRGHETDRLAALRTELTNLGGRVQELPDGLLIEPARLRAGRFHTYSDHRMVTAGAVLGLSVPGIVVEDVNTVSKTMPDFVDRWTGLLDRGGS